MTENAVTPPADAVSRPPAAKPPVHLAYLDGLRGLAALCVVYYHLFQSLSSLDLWWTGRFGFLNRVLGIIFFGFGHQAVDVFIVLSGFSLMLPVVRDNLVLNGGAKKFFQRRARRILPPYYICCVVSYLLTLTILGQKTNTAWDVTHPITPLGIVSHLFLFQDMFLSTGGQINYPLWSISVEWRIYLLFPLLVILWRTWGAMKTLLTTALVSLILTLVLARIPVLQASPYTIAGIMPQYLALFAFGMFACYVSRTPHLAEQVRGKYLVPSIAVTFLVTAIAIFPTLLPKNNLVIGITAVNDVLVGLAACGFLILLDNNLLTPLRRLLSWQPIVTMGTFAYSIYLMHGPVQQLLWLVCWNLLGLQGRTAFWAQFWVGVPVTLGLTYLFFLAAEKPFLTSKRKVATT